MSVYGTTIQYNDKVDLNTTSVADINKVSASDLNEIKAVVNVNANTLENTLGKSLWENPNPTASFTAQTVTLSESLANYNCYEIVFRQSTTSARFMTTGKIKVGTGTILNSFGGRYRPTGTTVTGNTIAFENGANSGGTNNNETIPVYVIGYKTGAF